MTDRESDELDLDGMTAIAPTSVLSCKGPPHCKLKPHEIEAAASAGCRLCDIVVFSSGEELLPTWIEKIH